MSSEWCTIESDPGVFTELLEEIGVVGVELQELWSLDDLVDTVHGLIFLFQWQPGDTTSVGNREPMTDPPEGLFFAHQVTTNACATQALLSIVMNAPSVELGPVLDEFKTFTASFPPSLKGEAIGSSRDIQQVHNSFARKDAFLTEGRAYTPTGDEDVFHFVAYIPFEGRVYELDGLQSGPILIGDAGDDWKLVAKASLEERMAATDTVKFNLMAVVQDLRMEIQEKMKVTDENSNDYFELSEQMLEQTRKREQWKRENQRRKHNYVPLCIQLIKELAKRGNLGTLVTEAQERARVKRTKKNGGGDGE